MSQLSEKEILSDALSAQKATTALFNTSANECVHEDVRQTMMSILNEEHEIQHYFFLKILYHFHIYKQVRNHFP